MPRYHEPYMVYPRTLPSGLVVYYYQTYDPITGRRLPGRSTGKAKPAEAYAWCEEQYRAGRLIPGPKPEKPVAEVRRARRAPTLAEWAEERHWWEWTDEGPECRYCRDELKRSSKEKPAVQREYADKCARVLRDNILPVLGSLRMDKVTPEDCEDLMYAWSSAGLSSKTVNNRASVARIIFNEAARLKVIPSSPWAAVKGYTVDEYRRGIITLDEYRMLMHPVGMGERWSQSEYYNINLLASVTGLRISECLALKKEDVYLDHITVSVKWRIGYGEGVQKTKRGTDNLPVPKAVGVILVGLAERVGPGKYIFAFLTGKKDGSRPLTANRACEALYAAMDKIGIKDDPAKGRKDEAGKVTRPPLPGSRQDRNITEHSWRAFANTYFLNRGIDREKVKELTRHESDEMTSHYRAWDADSFREIADAQTALVAQLGE